MREKFYFFNTFYDTAESIEDKDLKLKYLEAIMNYGINGELPTDPIIKTIFVQTKFTMDRSIGISEEKSDKMMGNQNAVKNFGKVSKQKKTEQNKDEQKKQEEEVEEEVEVKNKKKSEFELFRKTFPHARPGKKSESYNHFIKQNSDKVMQEVRILKRQIEAGLKDPKYIPACQRWIRDFTPLDESIKQAELDKILERHMKAGGDMKERFQRIKEDFGDLRSEDELKHFKSKATKIQLNFF